MSRTYRLEFEFDFDGVRYDVEVDYDEGSPGSWDDPPEPPEVDVLESVPEYPETAEAFTELLRQCDLTVKEHEESKAALQAAANELCDWRAFDELPF